MNSYEQLKGLSSHREAATFVLCLRRIDNDVIYIIADYLSVGYDDSTGSVLCQ